VTETIASGPPLMPGGGISKRPLHFIIAADCSGSMTGEKIQALNYAVADMLPHLAEWERTQEQARVLVRAVSFGEEVRWHVAEPTPVTELRWPPLRAKGPTPMGGALAAIATVLAPGQLERRALRPALLLITDGRPTDKDDGFDRGLDALMATPAGRSALRLALAIGDDAVHEPLNRFIGDSTVPVLVADRAEEIADRLIAASIAVSRMSEIGADRDAIARQVLASDAMGSTVTDADTIV
jgi:uncharacterized protein YegL